MLTKEPRGKTVLVVESDRSFRELIRDTLTVADYQVVLTSEGKEALQVAARHEYTFDLLLTDLLMPNFYGWDLAELLKLDYPRLKVIYLVTSCSRFQFQTREHDYSVAAKTRIFPLCEEDSLVELLKVVEDVLSSSDAASGGAPREPSVMKRIA